ncbi:MAG: bifunctional folylpolyglutamate synthase/dihydrofolate synthase [Planctomycetaceae bacterium]
MTRRFSTYEQAVDFLFGRINYEHAQSRALKNSDFKLDRMRRLLAGLGNPHEQIPAVHIAGTKGKGSTAVMLSEILNSVGYRVGLFTSPHLSTFEERMRVNGMMPTQAEVVDLINAVAEVTSIMDRENKNLCATFFEITTAMAWLYFLQRGVEIVSLEVGLGGRLDSTNLCRPEVCVITNISKDHVAILGNTVEQIAREKAGIIKRGIPVVSGVTTTGPQAVIDEACRVHEADLWLKDREIFAHYFPTGTCETTEILSGRVDVETPVRTWRQVPVTLPGVHQGDNAALALATVDRLCRLGWSIDEAKVSAGMQQVRWPARIEIVRRRPWVILDAAHNLASCQALTATLTDRFPGRRRIVIFAVSKDKDVAGLVNQMVHAADELIFTQYLSNPRATPGEDLVRMAQSQKPGSYHYAASPREAWMMAQQLSTPDDVICITGSFFLAAEMREMWLQQPELSPHLTTLGSNGETLCSKEGVTAE